MRERYLPSSGAPPAPPMKFVLWSALGAIVAIGLTGWLSSYSGIPWLMAPFGASCVLAFGVPESPLAQPRSIIGGHLISTAVGLIIGACFGSDWIACAVAVGLALAAMQLTRTVHAPAGADPLIVMTSHAPISYLLSPVLAGSLIVVLVAWCVNNRGRKNGYPRYWL